MVLCGGVRRLVIFPPLLPDDFFGAFAGRLVPFLPPMEDRGPLGPILPCAILALLDVGPPTGRRWKIRQVERAEAFLSPRNAWLSLWPIDKIVEDSRMAWDGIHPLAWGKCRALSYAVVGRWMDATVRMPGHGHAVDTSRHSCHDSVEFVVGELDPASGRGAHTAINASYVAIS